MPFLKDGSHVRADSESTQLFEKSLSADSVKRFFKVDKKLYPTMKQRDRGSSGSRLNGAFAVCAQSMDTVTVKLDTSQAFVGAPKGPVGELWVSIQEATGLGGG